MNKAGSERQGSLVPAPDVHRGQRLVEIENPDNDRQQWRALNN
jgi:hypothetical protein